MDTEFASMLSTPDPIATGGDAKGGSDFDDLSPEDLVSAAKLQDFTPATRFAAVCAKLGYYGFDFSIPMSNWKVSKVMDFVRNVAQFGGSNLVDGDFGVADPVHVEFARNFDAKLITASLKMKKAATSLVLDQITLGPELMKLCGASYNVTKDGMTLDAPMFGILVKVGNVGPLTSVVIAGGHEACKQLSIHRGVPVQYIDIPPEVHQLTSLVQARRTISVGPMKDHRGMEVNSLIFRTFERPWSADILAAPLAVELEVAKILGVWCGKLNATFQTQPPPLGMSLKGTQFVNYLGSLIWKTMDKTDHERVAEALKRYEKKVVNLPKISSLYTTAEHDSEPNPREWLATTGVNSDKSLSVVVPSGTIEGGVTHLSSYLAVNDYGEKCRTLRGGRDYMRKFDSPANTSFGQSASSVPAKFAYALDGMREEGVDISQAYVDAFGVSTKNHWENVIVEHCAQVSAKVVFKDSSPVYRPKGPYPYETVDILRVDKNSGAGKFIFDDTYVVDETIQSQKARELNGSKPAGKHCCYKKLGPILDANYSAGIIKMVLGSETPGPIKVGSLPPIFGEFKAKYSYVAFFPGGTCHSQEYLMAFGDIRVPSNDNVAHSSVVQMFKRLKATDLAWAQDRMSANDWVGYATTWLVVKAVDFVRANRLNTVRSMCGIFGGRFVPCHKAASSVRSVPLSVPLAGQEHLRGASINATVAAMGVSTTDQGLLL